MMFIVHAIYSTTRKAMIIEADDAPMALRLAKIKCEDGSGIASHGPSAYGTSSMKGGRHPMPWGYEVYLNGAIVLKELV